MRKTKIVCTIGPACDSEETLRAMMLAGMNVARLNFSHGTHAEHQVRIDRIKKLRAELDLPIAIMLDTKGPEYRIGTFENGKIELHSGDTFTFTTEAVIGNAERVSVSYAGLAQDLEPGDTVLVNDGLIALTVTATTDTDVVCRVTAGGVLSDRKSMSFPNKVLKQTFLSEQDKRDLLFGIENDVDFVAASFVSRRQDLVDLNGFLRAHGGGDISVIAKIENQPGIDNIEDIFTECTGIMIARGDMGVEVPYEELPSIQKELIGKCRLLGKRVITATEMLESMTHNIRPTRAEISDVANAIYDGTSAIMLSGETAAGAYPVEALKTMSAIAERTENEEHYRAQRHAEIQISVSDATAHAACLTAKDVNAAAIVTVSESGNTARLLSKYRPAQPIIACVMDEQVQRQLSISWGITPLMMDLATSTDELIEKSTALAKENGYLHDGELAVVTAGVPVGVSGTTNMIKIHMIGNCLSTGVGIGPDGAALANATGKACVCHTLEEIRAKFKPGMVLVVPSTSNEMLSYVRDAAALVVEEAGLNSHAAIAGKALLKPTIVGAVGATAHIRDGLMVAVDCAHGSVQRLQA